MHRRHAYGLLVAAAALWTVPAPASAWHEDDEQITIDTAYTLGEQGDVRLGLWRFDVALADNLDIGTYTLLYLVPFPNLQLKWRIWSDERWAISLRTGLYYVDIDWIWWTDLDSDAAVGIFPFELYLAIPLHDDWALHLASLSTTTFVRGSYDPEEFQGAAAASNQQLMIAGEWRVSRVTKLVLTLRWLVYERLRGNARYIKQLDEFTTVEIVGAAQLQGQSVRNAGSLMLTSVFSWEAFNLRVGLGYGNYNVPSINVPLPAKSLIGELDLYFRW